MTVSFLRIGVVGVGYRFSLLEKISVVNGGHVVAAADPRIEAREDFLNKFPDGQFFENIETMLSTCDLDVVFVMSPDYLHEEHVLKSLAANTHVFLEKPMAITADGCERIMREAQLRGKCVYVGHNMRHMGFVKKMKELIDSGIIGDVKSIWCRHFVGHGGKNYFRDWHSQRNYVGSLLLHKGSHDIDIIQWFGDASAEKVSAFGTLAIYGQANELEETAEKFWPPSELSGRSKEIDVEDLSVMQMVLKNGVIATYNQCHFTPDCWRNYTVIGSCGRLENFGDRSEEGSKIKVWTNQVDYSSEGDLEYYIEPDKRTCDELMLEDFFNKLNSNEEYDLPIAAMESVATALAATASMREGGIVKFIK